MVRQTELGMNTAQTKIHRDACFVSVTIGGKSMHAKIMPSKQVIVRLEADDMPLFMRKPEQNAVEQPQSEVAEPPQVEAVEQPKLGLGATIAGAAKMAASHLGLGAASVEVVSSRTKVCMGCPKNDLGRCSSCGCYLWAKVRQSKETCPIGKW
jgi:hypothetical protein